MAREKGGMEATLTEKILTKIVVYSCVGISGSC